jgi:thiosulfate/3-mercaptopyruvate sulfurtransferase
MFARVCAVTAIICSLSITSAATSDQYARPELLLDPTTLAQELESSDFMLFDVRDKEEYEQAHLPDAYHIDHRVWSGAFRDDNDGKQWSQRIGDLGISHDSRVVVYGDTLNTKAAQIWWILRYWGVSDVCLLNGGWKQWNANGLPTTSVKPPPVTTVDFTAAPQGSRLATKDQIVESLAENKLQIVDSRSIGEFRGKIRGGNKRGGAIPHAKHLEWRVLIDSETGCIKSPQEVLQHLKQAEIDLSKPTVVHCQAGGRSSLTTFALELMGADHARNYYRGWGEWGNDDDTPIVVPDENFEAAGS